MRYIFGPLLLLASISCVFAQTTSRVSLSSGGVEGDNSSYTPSLSGNGRFVVFESSASNLVAGDVNGKQDVFLRDRELNTITLVSVNSNEEAADGFSSEASVSDDGRYVVFVSDATNLAANDTNETSDIFVRDLQLGTTTRISVSSSEAQADGASRSPRMSSNGMLVAFESFATNLVGSDTNGQRDIFVRNLTNGTTQRVSVGGGAVQADADSEGAWISADGTAVAFASNGTNLVANDTNNVKDVFVRNLAAQTTSRVSVSSTGTQGDGDSGSPSISGDGRYVAFGSGATTFVAGVPFMHGDIYVHDRQLATTKRVSVSSNGNQNNASSLFGRISRDGTCIAFVSSATNLITGDSNENEDVFLHNQVLGTTVRVSVSTSGAQGNSYSYLPAINQDGKIVAFESNATNLVVGDTNGVSDVFVREVGLLFNFSLNKTTVAGQNSVQGTIALDAAYPSNTVFTTFDDSSLVNTPPTVTVTSGSTLRNFQITVTAITSTINTTVFCRLGTVTQSRALALTPLIPTALSFTPSQVTGGQSTSCRVVINGVAGPSGRVIAIFDNSPFATCPSTVTVPPGASSVTFNITTSAVTSLRTVTVTARVSAGEKTGNFRIAP